MTKPPIHGFTYPLTECHSKIKKITWIGCCLIQKIFPFFPALSTRRAYSSFRGQKTSWKFFLNVAFTCKISANQFIYTQVEKPFPVCSFTKY